MKIEGSLNAAISNMKYYIKVSNDGKEVSFDSLYNTFFNQFAKDEVAQIKSQINENTILEEQCKMENCNISEIEDEGDDLEIENLLALLKSDKSEIENSNLENQTESSIEDDNVSFKPSTFLNLVQGLANEEEIKEIKEIDNICYEEIHGIFIDEWIPDNKDYVTNGVFIDELEVLPKSNPINLEEIYKAKERKPINNESKISFKNTVPYGVFIDEWEKPIKDDNIQEDYIGDTEDCKSSSSEENAEDKDFTFDEFTESISEDTDTEIKEEVVVIPTNIRDFIKAHQGSDISYVLQYYKKKDIDKAVSLGKIYKKFGKLYV